MTINAENVKVENIKAETSAIKTGDHPQRIPTVTVRSAARVIGVGYAAWMIVLISLGLLLTRKLQTSGITHWDERVIRYFADHRTPSQSHLSALWSRSADAPSIIAIALVAVIVLAIGQNWREVIWLAVIVPTELAFFLTVSYAVGRTRPDVVHLGSVPSTGSFPSGHVAVTIVLYGTLAMIVSAHVRSQTRSPIVTPVVAVLTWGWTIVAAAFVGWARMYRGMHHPLDIAAGALLGGAVLYVGFRSFATAAVPADPQSKSSKRRLLQTSASEMNTNSRHEGKSDEATT